MDPREEFARLRGEAYIPPVEIAPLPPTVNMIEVQLMIDMAVRQARKEMTHEFEHRLAEFKPERSLTRMIFDLQGQVEQLKGVLNADINPCQKIPDPASITKLRAQIFHNTGKGVHHTATEDCRMGMRKVENHAAQGRNLRQLLHANADAGANGPRAVR